MQTFQSAIKISKKVFLKFLITPIFTERLRWLLFKFIIEIFQ